MDIVHRLGRASVTDVMTALSGNRRTRPSEPSSACSRTRGTYRHEEEQLRYVYLPAESPQKVRRSAVKHLVETFFEGSPEKVVEALVGRDGDGLSDEELESNRATHRARQTGRATQVIGATAVLLAAHVIVPRLAFPVGRRAASALGSQPRDRRDLAAAGSSASAMASRSGPPASLTRCRPRSTAWTPWAPAAAPTWSSGQPVSRPLHGTLRRWLMPRVDRGHVRRAASAGPRCCEAGSPRARRGAADRRTLHGAVPDVLRGSLVCPAHPHSS